MKPIIILTYILASISLISATYIATVSVPQVDEKIGVINDQIGQFRDNRQLAGIPLLNSNHISTRKRIDMLEANLNSERNRQIELRQKALARIESEVKNWAALFTTGDKQYFDKAEKDMEEIASDKKLTIEKKLKRADLVLKSVRNDAIARFDKAQEEFRNHKKDKEIFEKERSNQNIWFVRLQILGLILLTFSGIAERTIGKKGRPEPS